MKITNYIEVANKKYSYFIEPIDGATSNITCKEANLHQEFLNEDIVFLLKDLPNLILAEKKDKEKSDSIIRFRVTSLEKLRLKEKVKKSWHKTISWFIKEKVLS